MKCTKIVLKNRSEMSKDINQNEDRNTLWCTAGYHGYSYKLSARTKRHQAPPIEPQLTITTLMFPDDTSFNTGSSLERWSKKTPRLTSAKTKNYIPRKSMLDDEYDFSYEINDILMDDQKAGAEDSNGSTPPEDLALDFNDYYVTSDIEELLLKSQRIEEAGVDDKKDKHKKRNKEGDKKRDKFKKTIRFSFSKPPSPETEQVIRVDVTTNVSLEEMSQLENARTNGNPLKSDCTRGHHGKLINEKAKDLSGRKFDSNNNESGGDLSNEGLEEDFVVKCRQLALTEKKQ